MEIFKFNMKDTEWKMMDEMINKVFGNLTVIKQVPKPENLKSGGKYYLCQCTCGNQKIVRGTTLRSGATKSCGCLQKAAAREGGNNLTNQRFGSLTVIGQAEKRDKHRGKYWKCLCDCGNETIVRGDHLISGKTLSCGCLQKMRAGANKIDELGHKYGKLVVIAAAQSDEQGHSRWLCKCECGNTRIYHGTTLRRGLALSCGCLKSKGEMEASMFLTERKIKFEREYSFPDLYFKTAAIPLRFDFALFDEEDKLVCLIEFQGIQHFDETNPYYTLDGAARDELKRRYCQEKSILLLEITDLSQLVDFIETTSRSTED